MALLFAPDLTWARFYGLQIGVFAVFVLTFYRLFPKFLMQSLDGANLYFVLDKLNVWRSSAWETATVSPLESMTSTLWFPLNPTFIPPFWSFVISDDPTIRVYLLAVLASLSIFASTLFFYRAVGFRRSFSVAAAWSSFTLVMLQDTNLLQGINNVQVMAWTYICLALQACIGTQKSGRRTSIVMALFQVAFVAYVMGDPVWHLTTLPIFCSVSLSILIGAESASARWLQLGSLALALLVQVGLRSYESLYFTLTDTARSVLPGEYADIGRAASSAGLLFRSDRVELAFGLLLIVGLVIGDIQRMSQRPRLTGALRKAAVLFYVGVTVAGLAYIYRPESPAFRVGYIVEMSYPIAALFVAGAVWRLSHLVRLMPNPAHGWRPRVDWHVLVTLAVCLAVYSAWHISADRAAGGRLRDVVLGTAGMLLLIRFGWVGTATLAGVALTVVVLQRHVDASYGGGGDPRFDGTERMALMDDAIVRRLAADVGIQPGGAFRGYVEDVYRRLPDQGNVGDELVRHWRDNLDQYGSGHTLFSWSVFDIPTIGEYDPFIRPLYYLVFTRSLNESTDQQLDNYLGATRLNEKMLELMGVRFVVTDRDSTTGLQEVMRSNGLRVLEMPNPNLGSYSPIEVLRATTARDGVGKLASDAFDPHSQVVMTDARELPRLVAASSAELTFERDGYRVTATSPDWSLIVLPIQYSHCFAIAEPADPALQLMRVNLAQTGLLFRGRAAVEVEYRHWPLAPPDCQRQDYADTLALRAFEMQR